MNYDYEKTEELLRYKRDKKNKKRLIIGIVILGLAVCAVGIIVGINIHKSNQANEQIKIAEKYMMEGDYQSAITAYDEVLKIDNKHADAYEGKGDAYMKLDNPKKATESFVQAIDNGNDGEETYDKAVDAAEEAGDKKTADRLIKERNEKYKNKNKDKKNPNGNLGSTPENITAGGIVCQVGEDLYVANKPRRGCITKIDKKGKERIVFEYPDISGTEYIARLNVWDGWIYYALLDFNEEGATAGTLRKVKLSGNDDKEIKGVELYEPKSLVVIKDKLYYDSAGIDGFGYFAKADLDGTRQEKHEEYAYSAGSNGGFTTDGEYIYYISWEDDEEYDVNGKYKVMRYNIKNAKVNEIYLMCAGQMIKKDDAIYGIEHFNGAPDSLVRVDLDDKKGDSLEEDFFENYINSFNLYDDEIWFASDKLGEYGEEEYYDSYSNYDVKFYVIDAKDGKHIEAKDFTCSFTPEEIGLNDIDVPDEYKYLSLDHFCIINDKIYYQLTRNAIDPDEGEQYVAPIFGRMNIDGTDNEIYGY